MSINKMRKKAAAGILKRPVGEFEKVDLLKSENVPPGMTRAYRNNRFTVMIYDNGQDTSKGKATLCMVQRHDNEVFPNHWAVMQNIKNKIFGEDVVAVEYYPREKHVIDTSNIYWLWIFPEGVLPDPVF